MKKVLFSALLSVLCAALSFAQTRMVTFQVSAPDSLPVYVFGSWNWGGYPGTLMTSVGGGFYTATLPLAENTVHEYLFVNGTTGSVWSPAKEVLDPTWPCTNGNAQYTNRVLNLGAADMTVCNVFKTCATCTVPSGPVQITFEVQNPAQTPVYVFGQWSGWGNYPGDAMTPIGNGKYSLTLSLNSATPYEYLFVSGAAAAVAKEVLDPTTPCTNGNAQYTNRTLTTTNVNQTICSTWGSCATCTTPVQALVDLPLTFTDPLMNYGLTDFGGTNSSVVPDPTMATNKVGKTIKTAGAQTWAGTTVGAAVGFANAVPFAPGMTAMTLRVWSPDAGTVVRLKVEDPADAGRFVEKDATTTVAGQWETLVFNYTNYNPAFVYKKASVFFAFGTSPSADKTYYWDDMIFTGAPPPPPVTLPLTFEDAMVNYALVDFGGNSGSSVVTDPTNPANKVAVSTKTAGAQVWAGTTVGGAVGFATAVPFAPNAQRMTMRVWSPDAGIAVLLKLEEQLNAGNLIEKQVMTTMAGAWETLTFDFSTAGINPAFAYKKASVFFNFGVSPTADKTYYWDDLMLVTAPPAPPVTLPLTFTDPMVNYALTDFGGTNSSIVADPTNAMNTVGKTIKTTGAQLWAGTTVGGGAGFAQSIPLAAGSTKMNMRVWSPDAGIKVRLKVEDPADPTHSVETEATSTVAGAWETLEFDFTNQAPGTAAINYAFNFKKASVFFNFGVDGATAGEKTYYWDDMMFGAKPVATENVLQSQIAINLSKNGVNVFSNTVNDLDEVQIFDVLGRTVYNSTAKMMVNNFIPVALNVNTVYFIRVKAGNNTATFKKLIAE
jgi:gas vesicle protein